MEAEVTDVLDPTAESAELDAYLRAGCMTCGSTEETPFDDARYQRVVARTTELGGRVRVSTDLAHMRVPSTSMTAVACGLVVRCDAALPPNSVVAEGAEREEPR